LSGDPEKDYFSEGMTEEMIARLGRMDSRRRAMIGLASMAKFKDVQRSIEDVGRELGVNYPRRQRSRNSAANSRDCLADARKRPYSPVDRQLRP
jgi:TolB-like protein